MAAPFAFDMPAGANAFAMGVVAGHGAPASASSSSAHAAGAASAVRMHVPTVVRPDSFPACLTAPSLPPAPLLLVTPALHPHRGRVLLASAPRAQGEPLLAEQAFVASNWDAFRCAECDRPHATRRCAHAKAKWAPKILKKMAELEGSLSEASLIGSLDHARSFLKLLHLHVSESTLGTGLGSRIAGTGTLSDLMSLSSARAAECAACLGSKLPFQSSSPQQLLTHAGAWPSGLTLEDAGRMLSILNTNSHELSDIRGSGVFLRASLMEHSCTPNCNFSTTGREMRILALRPIAAGENLSIDYGMGTYRPVSERRRALHKSHGFVCFCEACTSLPDRARGFTCPQTTAQGKPCEGVVYPVGADDREAEARAWAALVQSGDEFLREQEAAARRAGMMSPPAASPFGTPIPAQPLSLLPVQAAPRAYPAPQHVPWSCTLCRGVLTEAQIRQCQQREREAARALRSYRDEEADDDEEPQFDFDKKPKGAACRGGAASGSKGGAADDGDADMGAGDEEDEDAEECEDDDDDGDEIRPPFPLLEKLTSLPRPSIHPSHHLVFWSLDFYARSCASDSDFAADAVGIFEKLLDLLMKYLHPLTAHDAIMMYWDYLAQVLVVTGNLARAGDAFARALAACEAVNGAGHHASRELRAMVSSVPQDAEELQARYAQFQEQLEAMLFETEQQQAERNRKAKGKDDSADAGAAAAGAAGASGGKKKKKKKKSKSAAARRAAAAGESSGAESDSEDDDPSASAPGPLHDAVVTPATQAALLEQMERLMRQRREEEEAEAQAAAQAQVMDAQGDAAMQPAGSSSGGAGKKGKGKKGKK